MFLVIQYNKNPYRPRENLLPLDLTRPSRHDIWLINSGIRSDIDLWIPRCVYSYFLAHSYIRMDKNDCVEPRLYVLVTFRRVFPPHHGTNSFLWCCVTCVSKHCLFFSFSSPSLRFSLFSFLCSFFCLFVLFQCLFTLVKTRLLEVISVRQRCLSFSLYLFGHAPDHFFFSAFIFSLFAFSFAVRLSL